MGQHIESEHLLVGSIREMRLMQIVRDWLATNRTSTRLAATKATEFITVQSVSFSSGVMFTDMKLFGTEPSLSKMLREQLKTVVRKSAISHQNFFQKPSIKRI